MQVKHKPERKVAVIPWVRQGIFSKVIPIPSLNQVIKLSKYIIANWPMWQKECIGIIETGFIERGYCYKIVDEEKVWNRRADKNQEIDFNRIQIRKNAQIIYEIRLCIVICSSHNSAKFWARIGVPKGNSAHNFPLINTHNLSYEVEKLRNITQELCKYMFGKVEQMSKNLGLGLEFKEWSWLEVSAFGVNDHSLEKYYTLLKDDDSSILDVLNYPGAESKLSSYYKKVTKLKGKLKNLTINNKTRDVGWFTSTINVLLPDGSTDQREVLFLMQTLSSENKVQAVGFGFDDLTTENIARRSVFKVATYFQCRA